MAGNGVRTRQWLRPATIRSTDLFGFVLIWQSRPPSWAESLEPSWNRNSKKWLRHDSEHTSHPQCLDRDTIIANTGSRPRRNSPSAECKHLSIRLCHGPVVRSSDTSLTKPCSSRPASQSQNHPLTETLQSSCLQDQAAPRQLSSRGLRAVSTLSQRTYLYAERQSAATATGNPLTI